MDDLATAESRVGLAEHEPVRISEVPDSQTTPTQPCATHLRTAQVRARLRMRAGMCTSNTSRSTRRPLIVQHAACSMQQTMFDMQHDMCVHVHACMHMCMHVFGHTMASM